MKLAVNTQRWTPLLEEALLALAANRLRSLLTMLGVVIGVASVILMLAIGEGSRQRVAASIASLGSNQLIVMSGLASSGGLRSAAGTLPTLTLDDAAAIAELASVRGVAPVSQSQAQAVFGGRNKSTTVTGSTPAYFTVNNMTLAAGSAFTETDVRTSANVAVLGATTARELFGDEPPIGQAIRIQRQVFDVIGVLKAKGQGLGGQDQDDVIVMPITTAQRKLAGTTFAGSVGTIVVEGGLPEQKGYTNEEITLLLRQRHRIAPGAEDDFAVRDMSSLTKTQTLTSAILSALLGSIAFISLLVGGLGIMNIMLVSVTERTREIGLRMARGARRASVLGQFLIESVLLSLAGALVGLLLGFATGWMVGRSGILTPIYSASSIGLSLGVAIAVGIGFGFWPARRAAQLEPVDALRDMLADYLEKQGLAVTAMSSAEDLMRRIHRLRPDLIVLDVGLPGMSGLDACTRLRAEGDRVPIVLLTARSEEVDRIVGLEMGADDYLGKPFSARELLARVRAVLRRADVAPGVPRGEPAPVLIGEFMFAPASRSLHHGDEVRMLSTIEYALLAELVANPRVPISRERLTAATHGRTDAVLLRTIDVAVMRLRKLLEPDPGEPRYIQTVRGLGYMFVPFAEPAA